MTLAKPDLDFYKQLFDEIDENQSGKIEIDEIVKATTQMGYGMDSEVLGQMIRLVDEDNDGRMDFTEFSQFLYIIENAQAGDIRTILFYAATQTTPEP